VIDQDQAKLLEILAQGALAISSIFFAILAVLFGAVVTLQKESEKRPLRYGIYATYGFTVVSLILAVATLVAVRYKTVFLYVFTIGATALTMIGMLVVATFMIVRTSRE
jgi:hypothetical protein